MLILVVVYLLGYFVDAVASLTEPLLHRMMGGVPSERMLANDYKDRIAVTQRNTLCAHMKQDYPELEPGTREFFGVIASVASTKGSPRLTEFLGAYVFARNILIALIVAELIACLFPLSCYFSLLFAALIVLCYYRVKQRGYYWAREAINVYIDCRSIGQPKKDTGLTT